MYLIFLPYAQFCIPPFCPCSHAHKATVMSVNWNKNGNWLLTASRDHLIKVYDIRAMKEMYTLKGHKKDVNSKELGTHRLSTTNSTSLRLSGLVPRFSLLSLELVYWTYLIPRPLWPPIVDSF